MDKTLNKTVGRPRNLVKTSSKTYMLFENDVDRMLLTGKSPKEIFKLGLDAVECGWTAEKGDPHLEEVKSRVRSLSWTLQSYVDKFNLLAQIVEKSTGVAIDPDVVKTQDLKDKLEELDKLE